MNDTECGVSFGGDENVLKLTVLHNPVNILNPNYTL